MAPKDVEPSGSCLQGSPGDAESGPGALVPGGCPCVRARCRAPAKPHPERTWAAVATPGPLRPRPCAASGNEGDGRIWPREPAGCKAPRPDPAAGSPRGSAPRGAAGGTSCGTSTSPARSLPSEVGTRRAHILPQEQCRAVEAQPMLVVAKPPMGRPPPCHLLPTRGGFPPVKSRHQFFQPRFCCPSPGWQKLGGHPAAPSPTPAPPGTRLQL